MEWRTFDDRTSESINVIRVPTKPILVISPYIHRHTWDSIPGN